MEDEARDRFVAQPGEGRHFLHNKWVRTKQLFLQQLKPINRKKVFVLFKLSFLKRKTLWFQIIITLKTKEHVYFRKTLFFCDLKKKVTQKCT